MSSRKDKKHRAWGGEIGPFLEEARKERGISLKEAEQATSIRWRYLEGLERENPAELPEKAYVQSFLRSYADFLGLDQEDFGGRFERYEKTGERPGAAAPESGGSRRRTEPRKLRDSGVVAAVSVTGLLLVLAAVALYVLWDEPLLSGSPSGGQQVPSQNNPAEENPDEAAGEGPAPTLETGTGNGEPGSRERLQAQVRVRGVESWISVETEAGVEYTDIAQPGFSRSFDSGESFRITTGNAGAVELRINGIDYGTLGASGEVTSKSFTLKKAS